MRWSTHLSCCDSLSCPRQKQTRPPAIVVVALLTMVGFSWKSSESRGDTHRQLYRPKPGSLAKAIALLEKVDLTEQDIHDYFCLNATATVVEQEVVAATTTTEISHDDPQTRFAERRTQIVEWASQMETGGSQIDVNQRLVPNRGPDPLPPIPQIGQQQQQQQQQGGGNHHNNHNNAGRVPLWMALLLDNEEDERRFLEREEREATEVIERTVKRYRDGGVPEDDFVFIPIPPGRPRGDALSLTFRRICFAVLVAVTAVLYMMLQTPPLFGRVTQSNPVFDKLLPELLHIRDFTVHARYCNGLRRDRDTLSSILAGNASPIDCSDGVLHIPAVHVLQRETELRSLTRDDAIAMYPFRNGVNVTWRVPCGKPIDEATQTHLSSLCFRGVHDGWLSNGTIEDALRMGAALVWTEEADHFDIHDNVGILYKSVPQLIQSVRSLLENLYFDGTIHLEPVAFRVQAALPMDATDVVGGRKSSKFLQQTVNKTNYIQWLDSTNRHNDDVLFSLSPFPPKPIRDTCNLMADMEANSSFAIHSSIFLSNGAGADYQGGVSLYVDNDETQNPRKRIRRGLTIDGTRGRIVVSSGGRENRRCRLPTRAGIRSVLQIWWNTPMPPTAASCDALGGD